MSGLFILRSVYSELHKFWDEVKKRNAKNGGVPEKKETHSKKRPSKAKSDLKFGGIASTPPSLESATRPQHHLHVHLSLARRLAVWCIDAGRQADAAPVAT